MPFNNKKERKQWWKGEEGETHKLVWQTVNTLYDTSKNSDYLLNLALYGDIDRQPSLFSMSRGDDYRNRSNPTYNVVKSCIDTAAAKIAKHCPEVQFLPDGASVKTQRRCLLLSQFIKGVFNETKAYDIAQDIFVDALIFGTGAIKVYSVDGSITLERVFIDEIITDDNETYYDNLRQLHQRRAIPRDQLLYLYPEHEEEINKTSEAPRNDLYNSEADLVEVIESWHLRSGKEAKDGKHTITIENATLLEEEYTKDYVPFIFYRWDKKRRGFYGSSMVKQLMGIQIEINKLLKNISIAQRLVAVPTVWVESGSLVDVSHISREIGQINRYTGNIPQTVTPQAMSPEVYQHVETLYHKAFELTGINQASAAGRRDPALKSGIALRTAQEIETERFILQTKNYTKTFSDLAKIIVDVAKDLYESKNDLKVKAKQSSVVREIKWSEVNVEEDKYTITVDETSALPSTLAGKLDTVADMIQLGLIEDKEYASRMLQLPDLRDYHSRHDASLNEITLQLENIVEEGIYEGPDPHVNPQQARDEANKAYLKYKHTDIEKERLQLIDDYIRDAQAMIDAMQASQAPAPQPNPQGPPPNVDPSTGQPMPPMNPPQ
jgi:hypothetical protein